MRGGTLDLKRKTIKVHKNLLPKLVSRNVTLEWEEMIVCHSNTPLFSFNERKWPRVSTESDFPFNDVWGEKHWFLVFRKRSKWSNTPTTRQFYRQCLHVTHVIQIVIYSHCTSTIVWYFKINCYSLFYEPANQDHKSRLLKFNDANTNSRRKAIKSGER
jgi:hypothetical protein